MVAFHKIYGHTGQNDEPFLKRYQIKYYSSIIPLTLKKLKYYNFIQVLQSYTISTFKKIE